MLSGDLSTSNHSFCNMQRQSGKGKRAGPPRQRSALGREAVPTSRAHFKRYCENKVQACE